MLKKTRLRLTAILSIITGAILTGFIIISVDVSVDSKIQSIQDSVLRDLELCKSKMYASNGNTDWIQDFEEKSGYKIFIEDKNTVMDESDNLTNKYSEDSLRVNAIKSVRDIVIDSDFKFGDDEQNELVFFNIFYNFQNNWHLSTAAAQTIEGETTDGEHGISITYPTIMESFVINDRTSTGEENILSAEMITNLIPIAAMEYYLNENKVITDEKGKEYALNSASIINDINAHTILILLAPLSIKEAIVNQIYLQYISLAVVGIILLCLVSWFLAKFILYPAELSMKEQKEFIAAAHHELRSPLAVVSASLDVMDSTDDEAMRQKYRNNAKNEITRMGRLVNDLLILSGSSFNKWKIKKSNADIDTLLIEISEQYAPIAEVKQIQLSLDLPDEIIGTAYIDNDRIKQIIHVLLDNAFSYCPKGSGVVLSCKKQKSKINFIVADSGNGISDEEKEKIFRKFYRTDKSRTEKSHFGLGLPVALELAQMHNGTLNITDTLGGGATFTLSIPISKKDSKKQ